MKKISLTVPEIHYRVDFMSDSKSTGCNARLAWFDINAGYFAFQTHCSASRNDWSQEISLLDWAALVPHELIRKNLGWEGIKQEIPEILDSQAEVHCDCPAFTYWGHVYNLTQDSGALYPNAIPPSAVDSEGRLLRDPDARRSCKHLIAVYRAYFQ